ncbi:MAG: hypothetical protein KDE04_03160 [Anaerolineales bacterium]|nr:hypothetical protein [Anaerolineales bacterium]
MIVSHNRFLTSRLRHTLWLAILLLLFLVACTDEPETEAELPTSAATVAIDPTAAPTEAATATTATEAATATASPATVEPVATTSSSGATDPGGLIQMTFDSQVGVLLDEVRADLRETIAANIMAQSEAEWLARAERQVRLTRLRLNFRGFNEAGIGPLPLTPREIWAIELDPAGPQRAEINGHDLILLNYSFKTVIVTDAASPGTVEPALAEIGGLWTEPFVFPADPDLLTQRTGNACINEAGFPPNSYDSHNYLELYDFACTADSAGALGCHRTSLPTLSCQQALDSFIGSVSSDIQFERLAWDEAVAAQYRIGPNNPGTLPDLEVVQNDLGVNHIVYRWFPPEDCALAEEAVGSAGWRRILTFNATVHNIGGEALNIGEVAAIDVLHNIFEYSPCHDHFHYSNYGAFDLVDVALPFSSKKAFCVQSTSRFSNNESSPLDHAYSCTDQGIQAGWVDEYIAGLDVQWIDITEVPVPADGLNATLGFSSNGDGFICEGEPVLDANGEQVWEPSGFFTPAGAEIDRPVCEFVDDWDRNNYAELGVFIPATGTAVTQACSFATFGPFRDCGFSEVELPEAEAICQPGDEMTVSLPADLLATDWTVRVCERSALQGGLACEYRDSLFLTGVDRDNGTVSFTCPAMRDGSPRLPGGFTLLVGPYWADRAE